MIPQLHLVLDLDVVAATGGDPLRIAHAAVAGGVDAVQLRGRACPAHRLLDLARRLRAALDGTALLLVNDRLDVALAAGAAGVQLPDAGLPPAEARALIRAVCPGDGVAPRIAVPGQHTPPLPLLIGCSVHDAAQARTAARDGADFLLVGTVFASHSHPEHAPGGADLLRAVRAAVTLPLIAIGGITPETVGTALAAGADGVAVMRAIIESPDPHAAAAALLRGMAHAQAQTGTPESRQDTASSMAGG